MKRWSRAPTPVSCLFCRLTFDSKRNFTDHFCRIRHGVRPEVKVSLHLTEEDVFRKGATPAIVQSRINKRYQRKREERIHRSILMGKSKKRANRALKHGWVPKGDIRHKGDIQV